MNHVSMAGAYMLWAGKTAIYLLASIIFFSLVWWLLSEPNYVSILIMIPTKVSCLKSHEGTIANNFNKKI